MPERERAWRARQAAASEKRSKSDGVEAGGRTEPYFGAQTSDELQQRYAFYNQFNTPLRRPRFRILSIIIVFAVGAALGLGGAWWFKMSAAGSLPGRSSHATADVFARIDENGNIRMTRGITSSELPYDGKPPRQHEQAAAPATGSGELPYDGLASVNLPARDSHTNRASKPRKEHPADATKTPVTQASKKAESSPKARPAHRTRKRITKEYELERIKRQAEEELKKKTDHWHKMAHAAHRSPRAAAASVISAMTQTHAKLARCAHAGNFFLREKCKWDVCGGMWGKNGCPSYRTTETLPLY